MKTAQDPLFENDDSWKQEWQDMPEFVQENQEPFAAIIVRFASAQDLKEFSELIDQPLTAKTKSIWHPRLVRGVNARKRWVDEP